MNSYWIKVYSDGTNLVSEVGKQEHSWSQTKLDGMIAAGVFLNGLGVFVKAPGFLFHQSDDYIIDVQSFAVPTLITRRIQVYISELVHLDKKSSPGCFVFELNKKEPLLSSQYLNQWFTIEVNSSGIKYYFSKERL